MAHRMPVERCSEENGQVLEIPGGRLSAAAGVGTAVLFLETSPDDQLAVHLHHNSATPLKGESINGAHRLGMVQLSGWKLEKRYH